MRSQNAQVFADTMGDEIRVMQNVHRAVRRSCLRDVRNVVGRLSPDAFYQDPPKTYEYSGQFRGSPRN